MAQKFIDLTDLNLDKHEFKLPFPDGDRVLVVHDPKTSVVLLFEQLKAENEKISKKVEETPKEKTLSLGVREQRDYFEKMVFLFFETDNEITMEEVKTLPFSVLVSISKWLKDYMQEVFLGDSPTKKAKSSSSKESSKAVSKSKKPTKSSE